ncbi:MAG: hypothetical protein PT937_01325 [Lactobacillaceae bacterium]|uniref:hypothetical protein n=1 Tax=Limosilactobacillus sp. TaxID=2773925 RepID=UPI002A74AA2A|nr:hypothetical protein [Limosilactobacillus sp.]MDD7693007.1 hypothetical protein [Lactobacillaceae bacterium]MDY2803137.1 hypothetical protein [Limosilactobacillus sp.]
MEAFEKDLNVIVSRRIADLYVLPFKHYYRLMVVDVTIAALLVPDENSISLGRLPS